MAIHPRFSISLPHLHLPPPSLHSLYLTFLIGCSFPIMTRLASHYSLFPHSLSPISFSSPPACLRRPPFLRGYALLFVVYCYRSVAHAAMMSFTSWIYMFLFLTSLLRRHTSPYIDLSRSPDALFSMYIVHHYHYSNESQRFFFTLFLKSLS